MNLLTRYITADEFEEYFGINLEKELRDTSNPSNKVDSFLKRVANRMETYLNANFFRRVTDEYPKFSNFQKEHYKLALLEQAYYTFKNGDIYADSGYDPDKGIIANKKELNGLVIAPAARDHLRMTGLWSRHIGNYFDVADIWHGN